MNAPHLTCNVVPLPPPPIQPVPRPQPPPLDASADGVVDAFDEELYWGRHFRTEPGYDPLYGFDEYAPAYRLGVAYRLARDKRAWEDCESELQWIWEHHPCSDYLPWQKACVAARAAWTRVNKALSLRH